MPNRRNLRPAIVWGDAFENILLFGYPLDEAVSYPLPREGSEQVQGDSGEEDAWDNGTDQYLEGKVRWIPRETGNTPEGVSATGWEGATGWAAFLSWARTKKVFRWAFDRGATGTYQTAYLVEPSGRPDLENDMTRALSLSIRASNGVAFDGY